MIAGLLAPLSSTPPSLPAAITIAGEVAWKAALLCLAAGIAHLLAGRRRVLVRSAIWHACLAGLLLLPVIVVCCPRMAVAVLDSQATPQALPLSTPAVESSAIAANVERPLTTIDLPEAADQQLTAASMANESVAPALDNTDATPASGMITVNLRNAAILLATAVYLLVVAVLLVRLAASLRSVAALRRSSALVAGSEWLSAFERWYRNLGLQAPVALRQSDRVSVPVVIGWRRPLILLPMELVQTGDRQVIDAVLLHELTHVARGDYAWNLLLRLVQTIYWPHPLVWLVGRMVRQVREAACDAVCVHWMQDVRIYCGILVDVAAGLAERSEIILGMAMSHSSRLSRRLARIECSPGSVRGLLGRRARAVLVLAVSGAVGVLGVAQFVPRVSAMVRAPAGLFAGSHPDEADLRSAGSPAPDKPAAPGDDSPGDAGKSKPSAEEKPDNPEKSARTNFWLDPESKNQYFVTVQDTDESKRVPITTVKVKRGPLPKTISVRASLTAFEPVSIHTRLAGVVSRVTVAEGDRVKKGDLLLELDAPDLEVERARHKAALAQAEALAEQAGASLESAQASVVAAEATIQEGEADAQRSTSALSLARKQHDRMQKLFELKSIDAAILDEQRAKLEAAEADRTATAARLQTAKANLGRTKAGVRLAEADLRAAKLRVAAAEADLKRSQMREAFREIRAPIDGVIVSRQVDTDVFLKPDEGRSLLTLAPTNAMTAVVAVAENDAALVKRGAPAMVTVPALEGSSPFPGKVSRVAYGVDPATRTVTAQITVANRDEVLKPGMFAQAQIVVGEIPDTLWVPASAVKQLTENLPKGGYFIKKRVCFRVTKGEVVETTVKLGLHDSLRAEILEGLKEGDEVVADPHDGIQDGQPVELIPPAKK